MRIAKLHSEPSRRAGGFSLIEVMIAVIVLATGLLALAALQINLTQSSADAKARSRIATLLSGIVDYQRAQGFTNVAAISGNAGKCTTSSPTTIQSMICTAQTDAGVSGIGMTQKISEYYGLNGAASFVTTAPTSGSTVYGDYKRVDITATWTDASGNARNFGATTLVSSLNLNGGATTVLDQNLLNSANLAPVVHETNPANTAGVIPIAIGNNTDTAATNPKPTVNSSSGANSVSFTTLTYTSGANDSSSTATIQKRVETEVAECVCKGSSTNPFASGSFEGENVFRPTYWNGIQYVSPSTVSAATPSSSAATSITQSTECDICCRDHNDTGISSGVKFDSVTGDTNRYQVTTSSGSVVTPVSLAKDVNSNFIAANVKSDYYLDACRMIRVDGVWRVATDIEASHMGLIATNDEQGSATNPATPDSTKETAYETFVVAAVKQYLLSALPTAGSPVWTTFLSGTIAGIFTTNAPNVPSTNPVTANTSGTYRYLHAHGLYIDHLETDAINKLNAVESSTCPTTATDFPTCLLAYLPFNTINLTNLAGWTDTDSSGNIENSNNATNPSPHLSPGTTINTTSTVTCSTGSFWRGCVTGLLTGSAYATATIGHSNSGIAASIPVSTYESLASNQLTASQQFTVSGGASSDLMYSQLTGPSQTLTGWASTQNFPTASLNAAINPAVTWNINNTASGNCAANATKNASTPNPYSCTTTTTLTTPTTITVSGYNQAVTTANSVKNPCPGATGNLKNTKYSQPGLICYTLSAATLSTDSAGSSRIDCGVAGGNCYNISSPFTVSNSKTASETSAVTIASKNGSPVKNNLSNTYLNLTFIANGSALGTYVCGTDNQPVYTAPTSCP